MIDLSSIPASEARCAPELDSIVVMDTDNAYFISLVCGMWTTLPFQACRAWFEALSADPAAGRSQYSNADYAEIAYFGIFLGQSVNFNSTDLDIGCGCAAIKPSLLLH